LPEVLGEHEELIVLDREEHAAGAIHRIETAWYQCKAHDHPYAVVFFEWDGPRTARQLRHYFADMRVIQEQVLVNGRTFRLDRFHQRNCGRYIGYHESQGGILVPLGTRHLRARQMDALHKQVFADAVTELGVVSPY
jgi:hypothetical protein